MQQKLVIESLRKSSIDLLTQSDSIEYAISHGGIERWLQTELALRLSKEFPKHFVLPENKRKDISVFRRLDPELEEPEFLIELGTNYLNQLGDIRKKPFNDIEKRLTNQSRSQCFQFMLISQWQKNSLPDFITQFPTNTKYRQYIYKKAKLSLKETEKEWKMLAKQNGLALRFESLHNPIERGGWQFASYCNYIPEECCNAD